MMNLSYRHYFLVLFVFFGLILLGLSSLSHGPKPKIDDVPLDQFSTGRALIHLSDLISDNQPHPTGTDKNREVLQIISYKFSALGYKPEVQKTLACTPHYPGCGQIENFIAVLKGSGDGDAIMLTTHYDSVPAGPGAGDAGAGVAALIEIARILKSESRPVNDIIFLITDGEEGGLRGAKGFAAEHPLMKSVKLMINLEARGASGPSTMFETSDGNRALIQQYAKASSHPVANSLSFEVYKRLPNDTDYSIYKPMGVAGLNFAFTGDVALYHSVRDDLAHLDKSSLQHHGDNALDAVRAFRDVDLNAINSDANATYFDLFGRVLVNWSSGLNLPLSILALIIMAIATFKSRVGWKQGFLTTGACLGVVLLPVLFGFLLSFPLGRWPSLFYLDHPHPWPGRIALLTSTALAIWVVARLFRTRITVNYNILASSVGVLLALFSLLASIFMTGITYQFLVPALAMALGFIIDFLRKHERFIWAVHLGLITTAYMAIYHFVAIEVIIPYKQAYVRIIPLIPLCLVLLPVLLRAVRKAPDTSKLLGFSLAALTLIATLTSAFLPGFNPAHPRIQNLVIEQNMQTSQSRWISETYLARDDDFLHQAGFSQTEPDYLRYGLYENQIYAKKAKFRDLPQPYFKLVSDDIVAEKRIFTADIQASNNGYGLYLRFPEDNRPQQIFINGQLAGEFHANSKGSKSGFNTKAISIRGPGNHIYRVKMVYAADKSVEFSLQENISLKPEQTDGLAPLRPENSAPGFDGDRIELYRHMVFK